MVSSTLDLKSISNNSPISLDKFGSFMSGDSTLGESVLNSAANNIVNFNSKVSPLSSNVGDIVSKISTNILSQVDSRIFNSLNLNNKDFDDKINALRLEVYSKLSELQAKLIEINSSVSPNEKEVIEIIKQLQTNVFENTKSIQSLTPLSSISGAIENITSTNQLDLGQSLGIAANTNQLDLGQSLGIAANTNQLDLGQSLGIAANTNQLTSNQNVDTNSSSIQPETLQTIQVQLQNEIQSQIETIKIKELDSYKVETVDRIQKEVQTILNDTIRNFSRDYQEKVKSFDDKRPNNVLKNFLELYERAIGFISYFGNKKNIESVEKNLKSLQKLFTDSFDVAKILRQIIIKIVNQLSNLPSASPSSGGLNLDINIPGGKLKQSAGPGVRNVTRPRGRGMLGLGLLGLGGLGLGVAAGSQMSKAEEYQQRGLMEGVSPAIGDQYIPETFIDSMSMIIDRFSSAIENFISGAKSSSSFGGGGEGGSSGSGGGEGGSSGSGGGGGGGPSGVTIKDDTQGLSELGLTQEEWNVYKQGIADVEVAGKPNGGYGIMGGAGGRFAGRYQMGDEAFTEASKVLGIPKPSRQEFLSNPQLQERMYLGYTISNYRYMQSLSPEFRGMTRQQQLATLPMAQLGIGNLTDQLRSGTIARDQWNTPTTKFSTSVERRRVEAGLNPLGQNLNSPSGGRSISPQSQVSATPAQPQVSTTTPITPTTPKVEPAPSIKPPAVAQAISQPVQKMPELIQLPPTVIDASVPQPQQDSGGNIMTPSSQGGGGPDVPFLPTGNPDNFFTMYSKIVYNIVDG